MKNLHQYFRKKYYHTEGQCLLLAFDSLWCPAVKVVELSKFLYQKCIQNIKMVESKCSKHEH